MIGVTNSFPKSFRHFAGYNAVFRVVGNYLYKGKKTKNEKSRNFCFKRYNFTCGTEYNKIRRTIALEPKSKLKQRPTRKPTNNIYNRNKRKKSKTFRISLFQQDLPWKPKSFCPAMEEFN